MTPDQYVESMLSKYAVQKGPSSPAVQAANAVAPSIRQWANKWLSELSFSGSYAKGTAISIGTDVDLFVSLLAGTPGTLIEIYENLFSWASQQGWQPRRQNVSIGITYGGTKIDIVPGRIQDGYRNYHSLYKRKQDSWTQTNISLHIDTIANSGRVNEIRAIKIWKALHGLDFPSFYAELFVIDALKYKPQNQLAVNVMLALNAIDSSLVSSRITDPANSNNIVSDDMTTAEKQRIASQARKSAQEPYWGQIIW
jgi:hypothetical protein